MFSNADAVGLPELDGRVGHHGAQGCRLGCDMKGRHKPSSGHYCAAHLCPNHYPVDDCRDPSTEEYARRFQEQRSGFDALIVAL